MFRRSGGPVRRQEHASENPQGMSVFDGNRTYSGPSPQASLACPPDVRAPRASRRARLPRALPLVPLAGAGALQYRRRRLRPLGAARARPHRHLQRARRRRRRRGELRLRCARPRTGSPTCWPRAASPAATGSPSCCRRRRPSPRATSRSTSSAPSRCRSRCCSASRRSLIGLQDSGARALITNAQGLAKLGEHARRACPGSNCVLSIDGPARAPKDFHGELARAAPEFTPVDTAADDPALMVYTSGTTGPPKGALHAHRVLLGHLPGIEFPHEFLPQPGDRFWTPADWAWAGGLLNVLLPGLHYGVPVVATKFEKFDPEEAFALMAKMEVRNTFIPPTALRMLRSAPQPKAAAPAALGRLRRRGARRRDLRMGQVGARRHHQRVLRPDRVQPGARLLRGDRSVARRRDRQAGAGPHGGGDPAGRLGMRGRRARPDRDQAARPGDVPGILGQARRHARQVHRRLDDHGRPGHGGRGRLCAIRRPRRRCDHLGRLSHRPDRDRGLPDPASRGRARRGRRQARSACAPRSSRRSSC